MDHGAFEPGEEPVGLRVLMKVHSHWAERSASASVITRWAFGGGGVAVWADVSNNTELVYTLWMVLWRTRITSLTQSLWVCMSSSDLILSSWTTKPRFIEVSSSGNGCWRLGRGVEGLNPESQNLSELRSALQEGVLLWFTLHCC